MSIVGDSIHPLRQPDLSQVRFFFGWVRHGVFLVSSHSRSGRCQSIALCTPQAPPDAGIEHPIDRLTEQSSCDAHFEVVGFVGRTRYFVQLTPFCFCVLLDGEIDGENMGGMIFYVPWMSGLENSRVDID